MGIAEQELALVLELTNKLDKSIKNISEDKVKVPASDIVLI